MENNERKAALLDELMRCAAELDADTLRLLLRVALKLGD